MWGHFVIQSVIPAVILSCYAVHHLRITLSQEGMVGEVASFGDWIRRRRRALDLTREALAGQVGCAVVTIRKIETDERRPSRQIAERLAECLQIPQAGQYSAGRGWPRLPGRLRHRQGSARRGRGRAD